jgi:hypothetical protein
MRCVLVFLRSGEILQEIILSLKKNFLRGSKEDSHNFLQIRFLKRQLKVNVTQIFDWSFCLHFIEQQ